MYDCMGPNSFQITVLLYPATILMPWMMLGFSTSQIPVSMEMVNAEEAHPISSEQGFICLSHPRHENIVTWPGSGKDSENVASLYRYTLGYHCVPMREEKDRGHGVPSLHHRQPLPAWSRASDLAISHWASNSCELTLSKEPASNRLLLPLGRRLLLWSKGTQSQQHSFHISSLHPFQVCTTKQTTKPSSSPTLSPFLPNSPQIPPY